MRIARTRLSGAVALAILITLLVERTAIEPASIAGFLVATLVGYLAWPAFEARLPAGYAWTLRPRDIVTMLLIGLAIVVASLLARGEPVVATTVALRFAIVVAGTFAIAVLWPSRRPT